MIIISREIFVTDVKEMGTLASPADCILRLTIYSQAFIYLANLYQCQLHATHWVRRQLMRPLLMNVGEKGINTNNNATRDMLKSAQKKRK